MCAQLAANVGPSKDQCYNVNDYWDDRMIEDSVSPCPSVRRLSPLPITPGKKESDYQPRQRTLNDGLVLHKRCSKVEA